MQRDNLLVSETLHGQLQCAEGRHTCSMLSIIVRMYCTVWSFAIRPIKCTKVLAH